MRAAGLLQLVEHAVKIQRLGRRVDGRAHFARQPVLDGSDHGRGLSGGAQHRVDQECSRRFSVRPRDACQLQPFVRLAVKIARGQRQRLPAMLHFDPRSLKILPAPEARSPPRSRPVVDGLPARTRGRRRAPLETQKTRSPARTRRESYSNPATGAFLRSPVSSFRSRTPRRICSTVMRHR